MAVDLTELQTRMEAIVGQSVTVTEGDDDWKLRRSYLNRAQRDWSERFDWPQLYTEFNSRTSTGSALASISLNRANLTNTFRKLAGFPMFASDIGVAQYPQIDPNERKRFGATDKYVYILGDPRGGYNMVVNPATFISGASVFIPYYRSPDSLVSGSDISLCPNPNYLVQQALYYYFQANEDERFQDARAEAERILATMLEFENVKGKGYHNEVLNTDESEKSFRWGRD